MGKISRVHFLTAAEAELYQAVAWYNEQNDGLGFEFFTEVVHTIDRVVDNPTAWTILSYKTRRCRTKRFPYAVIYYVTGDDVIIVSIMHLKREPESWRSNLNT